MRRFSLNLAALALAAAASAPAANASYLDFAGAPSSSAKAGQVTVNSTGITGVNIPLNTITGIDTPQSGPAGFGNLTLSFQTGGYKTSLSPTVSSFDSTNSSVTITGQDSKGATVTLFNGTFDGTTTLVAYDDPKGNTLFKMIAGGILGVVNQALDNAYGLSYSGLSDSTGAFTLTLDRNLAPTSIDVTVDPEPLGPPAAVPEPASIALMALGLPVAYFARRRALKKSA